MDERFITSNKIVQDNELENALRPRTISEYIGQTKVKESLSIYVEAAKNRGEALDHVLLYGPPGLGKTTLSHIIASELNVNIKVTSGPALEKAADLAALLTNLSPNDVLFIDEIHRMSRGVEEILYPAMEDFALDLIIGKGPNARNMRLALPKFTLIAATTRAGLLTGPLRDRFGVTLRLELYDDNDLFDIVMRSARILGIEIDETAGREVAKRCRGTPRIANRILRRVRDYAEVKGSGVITLVMARQALKMLEIDELGLDYADRNILLTMLEKFGKSPVGIDALAAASNEDSATIEDVIEPFLMQCGLISRTPRGRIVMPAGRRHINSVLPDKHFEVDDE